MNQVVYVASPESQQIHVWHLDAQGVLSLRQTVAVPGQVQPMTLSPDNRMLYVGVRPEFAVLSYTIDSDGCLALAGKAPLLGSPSHISTDRQGHFLFSASYSFNHVSVSKINENGVITQAPFQLLDEMKTPHSANMTLDNSVLLVPCLTEDKIRLFKLGEEERFVETPQVVLHSDNGAGPRHMAFHKNGRFAYCINELHTSIDVLKISETGDTFERIQTIDAMPQGFADAPWGAEIQLTDNQQFLYISDRTASCIALLHVSEVGDKLTLQSQFDTEAQPRGFAVDHSGNYLIAAGQLSNHIAVYRLDSVTGALNLLARYAAGSGPMWVTVLDLDAR